MISATVKSVAVRIVCFAFILLRLAFLRNNTLLSLPRFNRGPSKEEQLCSLSFFPCHFNTKVYPTGSRKRGTPGRNILKRNTIFQLLYCPILTGGKRPPLWSPGMAQHQTIRGNIPPSGAEIPDKLYFRIGEVSRLCDIPAYVLRFWESEFPQLKPHKGGTGQRLYRRRDVETVLHIKICSTTRATPSPALVRSSRPSNVRRHPNSLWISMWMLPLDPTGSSRSSRKRCVISSITSPAPRFVQPSTPSDPPAAPLQTAAPPTKGSLPLPPNSRTAELPAPQGTPASPCAKSSFGGT